MKPSIQEIQEGQLWMIEEGSSLIIGVTQNALDQVGAVSVVDLADEGDEFEEGDWMGEVRGKDFVLEMFAPCRVRISEINEELLEQPEIGRAHV